MSKRKIFVEVEVPPSVKKRLRGKTEKWLNLPIKWFKEENLHIILFSLGYVDESVLPEICQKILHAVSSLESFDLNFFEIGVGPSLEKPQHIELRGESSLELKNLVESIEKELDIFQSPKKNYRPHLILGKIQKNKWEKLTENPHILEKIGISISLENILVMENSDGEGGEEYHPIETCPLEG